MSVYQTNRNFGDTFIPEISGILGMLFLTDKYEEEDLFHETDLITLDLKPFRFAVRVRRFSAYTNPAWREQFTIRYEVESGNKTEFQKILEGYGDYIFYAFSDKSEEHLASWFIGDLEVFRNRITKLLKNHTEQVFYDHKRVIKNSDERGSTFLFFKKIDFPEEFIVQDSKSFPYKIDIMRRSE